MTDLYERAAVIFGTTIVLGACGAGPQITRTQPLADDADAPYQKILVIALLSSFDARRLLEDEVVSRIAARGAEAVPSTSMMNT